MVLTAALSASSATEHGPAVRTACENMLGLILAGRYRVEALLGEGGMANVFRVRHVALGTTLAAKILRPEFRAHEDIPLRFAREARLLSSLDHPNVVRIMDFGKSRGGDAFYIMEHLEGCSLADRIDAQGALPSRSALESMALCADALVAVHELGAVHRDLAPQNIMLLEHAGRIKLIDFGVAHVGPRVTAPGLRLGTPEYMAPEQLQGEREPDARSDLYALGLVLFESLTGESPFLEATIVDTLRSQLHRAPPTLASVNPSLAGLRETQRLIVDLLHKDPERRPRSAAETAQRIRTAIRNDFKGPRDSTRILGSTESDMVSLPPAPANRRQRWQWAGALGAAFAAGFLGGTIVTMLQSKPRSPDLPAPAEALMPTSPPHLGTPEPPHPPRAMAAEAERLTQERPLARTSPSTAAPEPARKSPSKMPRRSPRKPKAKPLGTPVRPTKTSPTPPQSADQWDLRDPFSN